MFTVITTKYLLSSKLKKSIKNQDYNLFTVYKLFKQLLDEGNKFHNVHENFRDFTKFMKKYKNLFENLIRYSSKVLKRTVDIWFVIIKKKSIA